MTTAQCESLGAAAAEEGGASCGERGAAAGSVTGQSAVQGMVAVRRQGPEGVHEAVVSCTVLQRLHSLLHVTAENRRAVDTFASIMSARSV